MRARQPPRRSIAWCRPQRVITVPAKPAAKIVVPRLVDRKSTRLNSSHTEIYTLSLHDALPIYASAPTAAPIDRVVQTSARDHGASQARRQDRRATIGRSEEHTSELQSHRDLHSFPTRRSSDLCERANRRADRSRGADLSA